METIIENFLDDIQAHLKKTRKDINIDKVEKDKAQRTDPDVKNTNSNYNDGKKGLDDKFVRKLVAYIDSLFPKVGEWNSKLKYELKKTLQTQDIKELEKVNKRTRDTVNKEFLKMLDNLEKRISKILVTARG